VSLSAVLFASAAAAGNAPTGESSALLRARATRLYRAKQFETACPLFEAALRASAGDPELLTDLALCQHRLGQDELARRTNLEAIARASEPAARLSEPRFARVRRHAYFNLSELGPEPGTGEPNAPPESGRDVQCWALPAAPTCSKALHACVASQTTGGRYYRADGTVVRVAQSAEAALFEVGDIDIHPNFDELGKPSAELPVELAVEDKLDFVDRFSEEEFNFSCEWSCENSAAVVEAVSKCRSNPKLSAADRERCTDTVCDRAERAPWAAAKAEQRQSDACYRHAATVDGEYSCSVVYANACTGLLGLSCSGHAGGERKSRTRIEEYRFGAASPP